MKPPVVSFSPFGVEAEDITAELARLFEERAQPMEEAVVDPQRKRPRRKAE